MISLLAACAATVGDSGTVPAVVGDNAPPVAEWNPDDATAAILTGLNAGFPDAVSGMTTYLSLMALGDSNCPGPGNQLTDVQVPLTGCTSSSGYRYAGVSMYLDSAQMSGGNPEVQGMMVGGDFQIVDPAGNAYDFGGQLDWFSRPAGRMGPDTGGADPREVYTDILGTFRYPGSAPWLSKGASAVAQMVLRTTSTGESTVQIDGGLGTGDIDLWMRELRFGAEVCQNGEPAGRIDVRDPSGAWWSLDFGTICSGCGALAYATLDAADACVDLTATGTATLQMMENTP